MRYVNSLHESNERALESSSNAYPITADARANHSTGIVMTALVAEAACCPTWPGPQKYRTGRLGPRQETDRT